MEKFIHESARELPVAGEYDVIVAGSGPAGVSAAIHAGRRGAKVLLLEWNNTVGGISHSVKPFFKNSSPRRFESAANVSFVKARFINSA